jgi:Protein of unknown function (DUF3553)
MTQTRTWSVGDKVVHAGRPEWGTGTVTAAEKASNAGQSCQMLTIRFDRAGQKKISTGFATLVPADQAPALPPESTASPGEAPTRNGSRFRIHDDAKAVSLEDRLSGAADIRERMSRLPDNATDPFATVFTRLKNTLLLYRFSTQGASLLDWAAIQSGLADPMSRFNRHELEQFFEGFCVARDAHLRKTLADSRKLDPALTHQILSAAPANAQQAMRRLDARR